ncbi:unnamed protein product [Durusdinium trenchii]|uniref:Ubiquitin-like domain-containing protein n=1 Tax=Durusdinium trenchii TaxID=1381693 RepID=A0ABP0SNT8_9DINO
MEDASGLSPLVKLQMIGLDGSEFEMNVPNWITAGDLCDQIFDHISIAPQHRRMALQHGTTLLDLDRSLKDQGLQENSALSYVFIAPSLKEALEALTGSSGDPHALVGLTTLRGVALDHLKFLPKSLKSLTFRSDFNSGLETRVPSLQSLTFGSHFNQSLAGVSLPSKLRDLSFGSDFNQTLVGLDWPSGLEHLRFGTELTRIWQECIGRPAFEL